VSPTMQGALVLLVTLAMLLSGVPVAFGLGVISILFLIFFQGFEGVFAIADSRVDPGLQACRGVLGLPRLFHLLQKVQRLALPPDYSEHVSETRHHGGVVRRDAKSFLELGDGFIVSFQLREAIAHEHVAVKKIRIELQSFSRLRDTFVIFARPI